MLRIVSSHIVKKGDSFFDEVGDVDWGDEPIKPRHHHHKDRNQKGVIDDSNLDQYLADDVDEPLSTMPTDILEQPPGSFLEEVPLSTKVDVPEEIRQIQYSDPKQLVYDAIDNSEIITFEYTNRHGDYAGVRTVEPHYTFTAATTGNEVLVTFDRDVNDIRAFIVGNIHSDGVRYEELEFNLRPEIMRGVY